MKVFQSLVKTIAVIFAGIFTFLISLTILFAGMSLELKPTRENKNPEGNFDDSYIRSSTAPSIIRTLTVSPQLKPKERIDDKSIKHSNDLDSVWGPDKSLSISGFQNVDSVGYFSVSIFGTIIVDTESQKGKKPSQLPKGWEFSGTGNYNVNYCTFPNISEVNIFPLTQEEILVGSQINIKNIIISADVSSSVSILVQKINNKVLENKVHAAFQDSLDFKSDSSNIKNLLCSICKKNSKEFDEVKEDIIILPPNMYLPKIIILNGIMGSHTLAAVNEYCDGRKKHEMVHYNNYITMLKQLKKCNAKFEGCSTTNQSKDYNKMVIDYLNKISNYYDENKIILDECSNADDNHDNDPETIEATRDAYKPFENITDSKIFE